MSEPRASTGTLYLVPVSLGDASLQPALPSATLAIARRLDTFIAENAKSARLFLKTIGHPRPMQEIRIHVPILLNAMR